MRHCAARGQWLLWDGHHWQPDQRGCAIRFAAEEARAATTEAARSGADARVLAAAKRQEAHGRVLGALALAAVHPLIAVTAADLDVDSWLLNVQNGTLDLRSGTLRPHRRDDLLTHMLPFDFDPVAPCARWDRFLHEVMDGRQDLVAFLRRWFGYCLTADVREHAMLFLVGDGRNGKGCLVETIQHVMGPRLTGAAPEGLLLQQHGARHPADVQFLAGRRLIVASEVPQGAAFNEERIKKLTGGDTLNARGMRQDFADFTPTHKIVVQANHHPRVRDQSAALWRRMRVVPFDVSFAGREDRGLKAALCAEAPGILAWLVAGCLEWQKHGLGEPLAVAQATAGYRADEDFLGQWSADWQSRYPTAGETKAADLHADLRAWCEHQGEHPPRQRDLARELHRLGWVHHPTARPVAWSPPQSAQAAQSDLYDAATRARKGVNGEQTAAACETAETCPSVSAGVQTAPRPWPADPAEAKA
ncbi:MAG: hypothetical protein HY904_01925 [Deltaproteobacteria bacterium]|nr:hypothetical protein [Deltaproteobacteria bacterium]